MSIIDASGGAPTVQGETEEGHKRGGESHASAAPSTCDGAESVIRPTGGGWWVLLRVVGFFIVLPAAVMLALVMLIG